LVFASQQNSIDNGDFKILYISHNNDNGGDESICTHLANSCSWSIRLEELLVGKIIDNDILLAWMVLLQQNQLL
jgi:hypothetical protein